MNFGSGKLRQNSTEEEHWTNVDVAHLPEVDMVMDLWKMPWEKLKSNYYDGIRAYHLMEHIPHCLIPYNGITFPWQKEKKRLLSLPDGMFAFMDECWRILKPGGYLDIVSPHGWSKGALQDPSHTRQIIPSTFVYFMEHEKVTCDYGSRARFKLDLNAPDNFKLDTGGYDYDTAEQIQLDRQKLQDLDIDFCLAHFINVSKNLYLKFYADK